MMHQAGDRAPFLTLWTTVVARHLGYNEQESLTLGRAVALLAAQRKARAGRARAGSSTRPNQSLASHGTVPPLQWTELLGRRVPTVSTDIGLRAVSGGEQIDPDNVRRYLETEFGEYLNELEAKMTELAATYAPEVLAFVAMPVCSSAFRDRHSLGTDGCEHKGALYLRMIEHLLARCQQD